jgi:hypothetical protein
MLKTYIKNNISLLFFIFYFNERHENSDFCKLNIAFEMI